jgi:hypothetical protein
MGAYVRRFTSDPGEDVLLEIESVNILDLEPPASITGIGTGTVLHVGEFEDGAFNVPTAVSGATDLQNTFGGFGYTYSGIIGNNPCARSRKVDSAVAAEYWNGNAFVQLSGKKFRALVVCRVDTSAGSVRLTRCASVKGTAAPTYAIDSGQTLLVKINGASAATATWDSAAATVTGTGSSFGTLAGGEYVTLGYDDAANFTTTFLAGDDTIAEVVARINTAAGFTFASNSSSELKLTGVKKGTAGQVRVVSGSTGTLAKLGLTAATTAGTGDVANSAAVTHAEVEAVIEADISGSKLEFLSDGTPRLSSTTASTGTVQVTAGTALALGFVVNTDPVTATSGTAGTIPAGTVVQSSTPTKFVTMQSVAVSATSAGPYDVKVRHATDDGTGATCAAGTITAFESVLDFDAFAVANVVACTALTEAQIDAAYQTAFDATIDVNGPAKVANLSCCARQSNACRRAGRQNAIDASAQGCYGRFFCMRPPIGTSKAVAQSSAVPGCKAYRSDRVGYCNIAAKTMVPAIARVGTAGGAGFTADGIVTVGSDGFLASVCSQLAPEENPGQQTDFLGAVTGLEDTAVGLTITDYTAFKAAGICALRIDDGEVSFQSGVTNVDPLTYPNRKNIARRRIADYIQDSLANRAKAFSKKLQTQRRRLAVTSEQNAWLNGLLRGERIESYSVDTSRNTKDSTAKGLWYVKHSVRTLSPFESIVIESEVGESVVIVER